MGLRYSKSVNVGLGFRINFSKSGIGYSWGVPGARFTKIANGRNRTTLSIPGTGISLVEERGAKKGRKNGIDVAIQPYKDSAVHVNSFENADVDSFVPAQYEEFIKKAKKFYQADRLFKTVTALLIGLVIYTTLTGNLGVSALSFLSIGVVLIVRPIYKATTRIKTYYDLDDTGEQRVALINSLVETLRSNSMVWQTTDIYRNSNPKRHSGANESVSRFPVQIIEKYPPFMRANVKCYCMSLKKETLYILPDKLLVCAGTSIGAIDWNEMEVTVGKVNFVERSAPRDAEIVGRVWKYANKDGSRDKRHKDNYQQFLCNYGEIKFKTEHGFNSVFHVSDINKARTFKNILERNDA